VKNLPRLALLLPLLSIPAARAQPAPVQAPAQAMLPAAAGVAQGAPLPAGAPLIAGSAWAQVLEGRHPRLLGPAEHLRALAKAKPEAYQAAKSPDAIRNNIFAAGIVQAVEPGTVTREQMQPYIDAALKDAGRGPTNQHQESWIWMQEVVLAYDFFHDALSAEQRQQMVSWLNAQLDSFKDDEGGFHNSIQPKILTYLRVAYATRGENPRAQEFHDYALKYLYEARMAPILNQFGAGGGHTEAGWYARGSLWYLVEALELARRVEGYDGFAQAPRFFYQRLALELFQSYPGLWIYGSERYPVEGDGSYLYGGHNEAGRFSRLLLSQYFRGSELARLSANFTPRRASSGPSELVNFLYKEEPSPLLPLESAPLSHIASGIGEVYARSDWSDNATWFRFNAGDYWTGHQHLDVGNFEIFHGEPLATESGEYIDFSSNHSINYLMRTIAHNCILVFDPNEKFPMKTTFRDGGHVTPANDGGQTKTWEWPVQDLDKWNARRSEFERADITAYQNTPQFLSVAADCSKAYNPAKLKSWSRRIVFLRPGTFVILDRVSSTNAAFEKTWLLHSSGEPKIAGQTISIAGAEGKGKLQVQTLLPRNATLRTVKGATYHGQSFEEAKSGQSDAAPQWRLEVLPATPATDDVFLHVLSTDDSPQPARLIERNGQVGVDVGGSQVMFEGAGGGSVTVGGKSTALRAGIQAGKFE